MVNLLGKIYLSNKTQCRISHWGRLVLDWAISVTHLCNLVSSFPLNM